MNLGEFKSMMRRTYYHPKKGKCEDQCPSCGAKCDNKTHYKNPVFHYHIDDEGWLVHQWEALSPRDNTNNYDEESNKRERVCMASPFRKRHTHVTRITVRKNPEVIKKRVLRIRWFHNPFLNYTAWWEGGEHGNTTNYEGESNREG